MWQRLAALLCLAAFLCGTSGVLPAFIILAGQLDDDHHVVVSSFAEKLQIRFHHAHDAVPAANAAGKGRLDESRSDSPADHVIEFVSPGDSLLQLPSLATLDHGLPGIAMVEGARFVLMTCSCLAAPHARPPPGDATRSRCLRSVVLLV
jgi:hypothetical protein